MTRNHMPDARRHRWALELLNAMIENVVGDREALMSEPSEQTAVLVYAVKTILIQALNFAYTGYAGQEDDDAMSMEEVGEKMYSLLSAFATDTMSLIDTIDDRADERQPSPAVPHAAGRFRSAGGVRLDELIARPIRVVVCDPPPQGDDSMAEPVQPPEAEPHVGKRGWMTFEPCPDMGGLRNPKLVLDDGTVLWGYQCWWDRADEEEVA